MADSPTIAILSGKGGTGKTLISVNLAVIAGQSIYIDCDVEEPNGHLFFKPTVQRREDVTVKIPVIAEDLCDSSRKCIDFCRFNALAFIGNKPFVFEEICHSCGGCKLVCPRGAISEKDKSIGRFEQGVSGDVLVNSGYLNAGEASGVPIINKLLAEGELHSGLPTFIDCPPGSACIVMDSIKDADYCILVAEPTIFGAHNLAMVYNLVKLFAKPHGVVLNKCHAEENPAEQFCIEHRIPILGKIPFDQELGRINSDAKIAVQEDERFKAMFSKLLHAVMREVQHEATLNS